MKNLNKNERRRKIIFTSRFFALMTILIGIGLIFIFKLLFNEMDMTGPIFAIMLGTLGYIGTFGEDK